MLFSDVKRKYLFKCIDCGLIIAIELDTLADQQSAEDNKMELDCPCEGKCLILRD